MTRRRLQAALDAGLALPDDGPVVVLQPPGDLDLAPIAEDRLIAVQPRKPDHDRLRARGIQTLPRSDPPPRGVAALVFLPRARAAAEAAVARASAAVPAGAPVLVDGAKSDGIDALRRAVAARVEIQGRVAGDHGRLFWFSAPGDERFADWEAASVPSRGDHGFVTGPGLFSADGIDPGSADLVAAMPPLSGHVVDLGAGWGYLAASVLAAPAVEAVTLVEADLDALDAARRNVADPRAGFVWADARDWHPPSPVDAVVTNPPFHQGRRADPALGLAFIDAAGRMLAPHGALWLVANRHLPYESALQTAFATVEAVGGTTAFKVIRAQRPHRAARPRLAARAAGRSKRQGG